MAHALDRHAEKAFGELGDARERLVCEKVFRALTDRGTDARGIRRPIQLDRLRRIAGASAQELSAVLNAFRKPSRSFLMPPVPEALAPDTIIDISHESLMRVWGRLTAWTEEEAECARMFRRIQDTAALNRAGKAGLWQDPDLQLALDWRARVRPTPEWSELYAGGLGDAISFIEKSKFAKDEADAKAEAELLWRTRFVVPGVVVLALGYALASSAIRKPVEDLVSEHASSVDKFATTLPLRTSGTGTLANGAVATAPSHGQAVLYSTLGLFVATSLPVVPFFLVGIALHRWGRKQYLEFKVPRLLRRAETAADKALLAEDLAPEPVSAIDALGTSYASFGRRMLGSLIDFVAFIATWFVAMFMVGLGDAVLGTHIVDVDIDPARAAIVFWTTLGLAFVFTAFLEAMTTTSRLKGTPGMMALGVIATNPQGERLSFRNAALRRLLRPVSYFCVLGVLIQPLTKRRQALHDLLTGSVILRRPTKSPS